MSKHNIEDEILIKKDNLLDSESKQEKSKKKSSKTKENKNECQGYKGLEDYHTTVQHSLLSSQSAVPSLRGLFNLGFYMIFLFNFRLAIYNFISYGWIDLPQSFLWKDFRKWPSTYPIHTCTFIIFCIPSLSYYVEKTIRPISSSFCLFLHILIIMSPCIISGYVTSVIDSPLIISFSLMLFSIIYTLKLISFVHFCYDIRLCYKDKEEFERKEQQARLKHKRPKQQHPPIKLNTPKGYNHMNIEQHISLSNKPVQNNGLRHLYYFLIAPTLIYQLSYPRYPGKIRYKYILKRIAELIFGISLFTVIGNLLTRPIGIEALTYFEVTELSIWDILGIFERILLLTVPFTLIFLVNFYLFFHTFMNLLAEATRFGDRLFYGDWWNSIDLGYFWRKWNLTTHNWIKRHLYFPALEYAFFRRNKKLLQVLIFVISGIFHEIIICFPLRVYTYWMFFAIAIQPLFIFSSEAFAKYIYFQTGHKNHIWGNIMFWFLFCTLGFPSLLLLYYQHFMLLGKGWLGGMKLI